ncbi:hypothetical protein [Mycobacterium branderi]|uniref:Uncharacterized protein n=1 Tax=Mycobacterium branderi TaxID=43348 RepID=A0A7I7WEK9_9MYCO|nr:hypothetical protein [Mycobacterium branderi]MCV7234565.1 hypothetical protein [Mycobacterium branderi]ORA28806.1 hypothetical protein BST20_28485 [Mycobacterium branderi]BBZ15352.1 hypothetical protein MBRA_55470 [Mycobacterium branderi]
MYQLIVDTEAGITTSDHPDRAHAHAALMRYIIDRDYYLRLIRTSQPHSIYELLQLRDLGEYGQLIDRRPRSAGHAIIEEFIPDPGVPTKSLDNAAAEAHRWLDDHRALQEHGAEDDPGAGYPLATAATRVIPPNTPPAPLQRRATAP